MHKGPKLHHIVLEGGACQKETSPGVEPEQRLPPLTLKVFDVLSLIKHHVVPLLASEHEVVLDDQLVRCDANMERIVFAPALSFQFSLLLTSEIGEHLQRRTPPLELHFPVDHNSRRHDDQMGAPDAAVAC